MSQLRKITCCQAATCKAKGGGTILRMLERVYTEEGYYEKHPDLQIEGGDCMGDCEQGPIVKVNDAVLLRHADKEKARQLLDDPEAVLGEVMHVLDEDQDTFNRILSGDLF